MPVFEDDDRPKKKVTHEIGQDLSLLSVEELSARVQLLQDEIKRLEADMAQKRATPMAADQFFKREARTGDLGAAPKRIKFNVCFLQLLKALLSFLDHYWHRAHSWALSGSCPLCLTPPCYPL